MLRQLQTKTDPRSGHLGLPRSIASTASNPEGIPEATPQDPTPEETPVSAMRIRLE